MQYVSIDVETGGLNEQTASLIEFGAVVDDMASDLSKLPVFHRYILNYDEAGELHYQGHPYALAMHQDIFQRIASLDKEYNFCEPKDLGREFRAWLIQNMRRYDGSQKITVAGKNFNGFDRNFLKLGSLFEEVKIHHRVLDPTTLYWKPFEDMWLPSLDLCLERAGLSGSVKHNAVDDAKDVIRVIRHYYDGI